jgi:murein DD-endopeptidase MepM/ murein hydrolase activator NlpD
VITSPYLSTIGYGGERRNNVHKGADCHAIDYYPVIFPIMDGEVIEIGIDDIYGKYVIVKHIGGLYSKYAHGKTIYYSASGNVTTDTPLMIMGSTGYSDSPHLHIEVYKIVDNQKIFYNPVDFF